jgi:hypothetical protein
VIRPSTSPWATRVLLSPKKDWILQLCVYYRALNKQTIQSNFPTPVQTLRLTKPRDLEFSLWLTLEVPFTKCCFISEIYRKLLLYPYLDTMNILLFCLDWRTHHRPSKLWWVTSLDTYLCFRLPRRHPDLLRERSITSWTPSTSTHDS